MKPRALLPLLALLVLALTPAQAAPLDDLASPDQAVRDRAAAEIRATYQPPEAKWTPLGEQIHKGQTKKEIEEILRPYHVTTEKGTASGGISSQTYRLDREWVLTCLYIIKSDILFTHKLARFIKRVSVPPGPQFTGPWTLYFVNGQKSDDMHYKDGAYFGEYIVYRSDGTKLLIQQYAEGGLITEEVGYFPSGKIAHRYQYKSGQPVGTWTWYDEAGKVTSTKEFP